MAITVKCEHGHTMQVGDQLAGKWIHCSSCQVQVQVPGQVPRGTTSFPSSTIPAIQVEASEKPILKRSSTPMMLAAAAVAGLFLLGVVAIVMLLRPKSDITFGEKNAVEDVAKNWFHATATAGRELLTRKARENITTVNEDRFGPMLGPGATYEVSTTNVSGQQATVRIAAREAGREMFTTVLLRRDEDHWRVYGFERAEPPAHDTPARNFRVDFENPDAIFSGLFGFKGDGKDFGKRYSMEVANILKQESEKIAAIEATDKVKFEQSWRTSVDIANRPALEVLLELTLKHRLKLVLNPDQRAALAKFITIKAQGSQWELLEKVCQSVGMYPMYSRPTDAKDFDVEVVIAPLPRVTPIAFAGPTLLENIKVDELVPHATGLLSISSLHSELPSGVIQLSDTKLNVKFTRIVGENNRDLHDISMNSKLAFGSLAYYNWTMLKGLFRSVQSIKSCSGSVNFSLPTKVEVATFTELVQGAEQTVGGMKISLISISKGESSVGGQPAVATTTYRFDYENIAQNRVFLLGFNSNHQLIASGTNTQLESPDGTVASIEAKVITESQEIEYPFELLDIPLTKRDSMPESIEPLKISGDVPARVEWESIVEGKFKNFKDAKFHITNFTNKTIRFVELELTVADQAQGGKTAFSRHYTYSPKYIIGGKENLKVVDPNARATFVVPTMFLPNKEAKTKAEVKKIGFADATDWSATKE